MTNRCNFCGGLCVPDDCIEAYSGKRVQEILDTQRIKIANWLLDEANHGEYAGWEDIRQLGLRLRDKPETIY
jgi:hypothetical protein